MISANMQKYGLPEKAVLFVWGDLRFILKQHRTKPGKNSGIGSDGIAFDLFLK